MILKIAALCVAVAMICSALRLQRPELATALSLAAGLVALALLAEPARQLLRQAEGFRTALATEGDVAGVVLKGAGIAVISELAAQLCVDAGESALAGRVTLAARVATLSLCAPMIADMARIIAGVLG